MYRCDTDRLQPGMTIGRDVRDDNGTILLRGGVALEGSYIAALQRRGQRGVMVLDGIADDVPPRDVVAEPLRTSVTTHLRTLFEATAEHCTYDVAADGLTVDGTIAHLGRSSIPDATAAAVNALRGDVARLLDDVLEAPAEASLITLKGHNDYTYHHSVDVAAVGAVLGARAGLQKWDLEELVLGCLLHDIGKVHIDNAILDKPGPLTDEEFAEVQRHPELGFEIVRRLPIQSIIPAHVCFQHHERQDGGGYPRGLVGSNRAVRRSAERLSGRRLLLMAEVAAVADVYTALVSDRAYRKALRHDVAADLIAGMAGRHLNRELVDLFLETVPRFPVGHWVEVVSPGAHTGWRGVVEDVPPGAMAEPTVRLLVDASGDVLEHPDVVDLRDRPDLHVQLTRPPASHAPATA